MRNLYKPTAPVGNSEKKDSKILSSKTTLRWKYPDEEHRVQPGVTNFKFDHSSQMPAVPSKIWGGNSGSKRTMNRSGKPVR
jgi:hypothetical protein